MPRVNTLEELRALKPQILAITDRYGLKDIRVFGSIVRGEMTEESDIDFLARYPEENFSYFDLFHCGHAIENITGREIEFCHPEYIRYPSMEKHILNEAVAF